MEGVGVKVEVDFEEEDWGEVHQDELIDMKILTLKAEVTEEEDPLKVPEEPLEGTRRRRTRAKRKVLQDPVEGPKKRRTKVKAEVQEEPLEGTKKKRTRTKAEKKALTPEQKEDQAMRKRLQRQNRKLTLTPEELEAFRKKEAERKRRFRAQQRLKSSSANSESEGDIKPETRTSVQNQDSSASSQEKRKAARKRRQEEAKRKKELAKQGLLPPEERDKVLAQLENDRDRQRRRRAKMNGESKEKKVKARRTTKEEDKLSKRAKNTEQQRRRRQNQTEEQKELARQKRLIRNTQKRAEMTEEERKEKQITNYMRYQAKLASMTPEEKERRREKQRERGRLKYQEKKEKLGQDKIREYQRKYYNERMPPEVKARFLEDLRQRQKKRYAELKKNPEKYKAWRKMLNEQKKRRFAKMRENGLDPYKYMKGENRAIYREKEKWYRLRRKMVQEGLLDKGVTIEEIKRWGETAGQKGRRVMQAKVKKARVSLRKNLETPVPEEKKGSGRPPKIPEVSESDEQKPQFQVEPSSNVINIVRESHPIEQTPNHQPSQYLQSFDLTQFPQPSQYPYPSSSYNFQNQPAPSASNYGSDYNSSHVAMSSASSNHSQNDYQDSYNGDDDNPSPGSPVGMGTDYFEDLMNTQPKIEVAPVPPSNTVKKRRPYQKRKQRDVPSLPPKNSNAKKRTKRNEIICDQCGEGYNRTSIVAHKRQMHNPDYDLKSRTCRLCNLPFSNAQAWYSHYHKTHKRLENADLQLKPFICSECGKGFTEKNYLLNHTRYQHRKEKIQCQFCPEVTTFDTEPNYRYHLESRHPDQSGKTCGLCNKPIAKKESLHDHFKEHHPQQYFPCPFCSVVKYSQLAINFHFTKNCYKITKQQKSEIMSKWKDGPFTADRIPIHCQLCKRLVKAKNLIVHFKELHKVIESKNFPCGEAQCTKVFQTRAAWVIHLEEMHKRNIEEMEEVLGKVNAENTTGMITNPVVSNAKGGKKVKRQWKDEETRLLGEGGKNRRRKRGERKQRRNVKVICEEDEVEAEEEEEVEAEEEDEVEAEEEDEVEAEEEDEVEAEEETEDDSD